MKAKAKKQAAHRLRIAYIGGGSRGWAHAVMNDLALCPDLCGELALYDIDKPMAQLNARWGKRLMESPQARGQWRFTVADTLGAALKGADFVFASIQPGPMSMMASDVGIPLEYGIVHPVGDTVGPAGLCRSLRAVADYAAIAQAVRRYCPRAWVINYTNPMSACTRALYKVFPQIKAFGCCHEVFGTQRHLAELVQKYHGVMPTRDEVRVNVLAVNHFTWIDRADYQGIDLLALFGRWCREPGVVREIPVGEIAEMGTFGHKHQVSIDLFRRYGILPAAGERHLVEFVPFYAKDEPTLNRWGVKSTPVSWRVERYERLPKEFRHRLADRARFELKGSGEESVRQIKAVLGMADLRTNVNLPNVGQIDGLPRAAVVETNAWFTRDSVKPEFAGRLPAGVEALVQRTVACQEMIVEAALRRDKLLAFQAFLNDPLMSLPTDRAWRMFTRMLRATKANLPGWKI